MVKESVKIKDNISIVDEIAVIENIASYYFTDGEYTPYYADMAKVTAIARYFLDGIEFEIEDNIYELVMNDVDIYKCVKKFLSPSVNKSDAQYYERMENIMDQVNDIIEFRKQKMIHNTDAFSIVGEMCQVIVDSLSNFANLNIQSIDPESIQVAKDFMMKMQTQDITEETLASAIRDAADNFKMPENEIIEEQRKRIAEQQTQLQEKESKIQDLAKWKREHQARNVKAVKESKKSTANSTSKKVMKIPEKE